MQAVDRKRTCILAIIMAAAVCIPLASCSLKSSHEKEIQSVSQSSFTPPKLQIRQSNLYKFPSGISVGGIRDDGKAQSNGNEIALSFPKISQEQALPEGISVGDFRAGMFDEESFRSLAEQLGAPPDAEGNLPPGISYLVVQEKLVNTTKEKVFFDLSKLRFALIDVDNEILTTGAHSPLWQSEWRGSDAKRYWILEIDAGESFEVSILYVLKDEDVNADNLIFLVDEANTNYSDKKLEGVKAFEVSGHIELDQLT